ncbi:PilW family protein [Sessilibacter corallicola]|uniref:Type IV pilus assembly protein PilW n=1 Tax=Sessilibacter corallicola TaxID=2904075 RepID=A0ABQ0A7B2_9GAMM
MRLNFPAKSHQGYTIIELLVALLLGAVLLLGAIQVFDSSREGARVQNAMSSVQDGGRVAMEFLTRDIRNADFSGCVTDPGAITNNLSAVSPGYLADVHTFYDLGGVNGVAEANGLTIDDIDPEDGGVLNSYDVIDDTSTLTIVGARPACNGISVLDASAFNEADPLNLRAACDIDPGTVLLVSNCQQGDIFVKTNAVGGTQIQHIGGVTTGGFMNNGGTLSETYKADAQVLVPFVREYFVAEGLNGNNSLYRRDNGSVQELISNVTDFQVIYGQDSDDDGAADTFADNFADMTLVVSARVSLTVRSDEELIREVGDADSRPITRTYSSTTSIRNRIVRSTVGGP